MTIDILNYFSLKPKLKFNNIKMPWLSLDVIFIFDKSGSNFIYT
jgi:hypothetical protein